MGGSSKDDKKKKRAKKDPDAPKRNRNAYMFFCQAMRTGLKTQDPGLKMIALSKLMGGKWKGMDADAKKPYGILHIPVFRL